MLTLIKSGARGQKRKSGRMKAWIFAALMGVLLLTAGEVPDPQLNMCLPPQPICLRGQPVCLCDQFGLNCMWACAGG